MRAQGLKSLGILLLVVLPLALGNSSSAKLGLPKSFTEASGTGAPAKPAQPVVPFEPVAPAKPATPSLRAGTNIFDSTGSLQDEIGGLREGGLSNDDLDRIKDDIREEVKGIDDDLKEISDDVDQSSDDLRHVAHDKDVKGSDELAKAQSKEASLDDQLRDLKRRLFDIKRRANDLVRERDQGRVDPRPLLADVRALGRAIDAVQAGVDEFDVLVSAVEDKAD